MSTSKDNWFRVELVYSGGWSRSVKVCAPTPTMAAFAVGVSTEPGDLAIVSLWTFRCDPPAEGEDDPIVHWVAVSDRRPKT